MKIKFLVLSLFAIVVFFSTAGTAVQENSPVKWMTFEEAVEKSKVEKRKIFIDVYTDWCGWCKVMDKNTFSEPKIAKILNEEFYAVKFDGEQREDVVFNGRIFKFYSSGGKNYHELAVSLMNNNVGYPTVVFLDSNFGMITPVPNYQKPEDFHKILQWISEDHYKNTSWADWQVKYKSPY